MLEYQLVCIPSSVLFPRLSQFPDRHRPYHKANSIIYSTSSILPVLCAILIYCNVDRCPSAAAAVVVGGACSNTASNQLCVKFEILSIQSHPSILPAKNGIQFNVFAKKAIKSHIFGYSPSLCLPNFKSLPTPEAV